MTLVLDDFKKKLPDTYNKEKNLHKLLGIIAEQFTIHNERIEDVRAQLYAESATWSLSRWEDEIGLKIAEGDVTELRRSRVMAKLRTRLPYSASMLASIAEAFTRKPVTVTVNASEYTIQFTFNGAFITDPNFYEQIDNAIQAHMLPLYRSNWEYERTVNIDQSYTALSYPFQAYASDTLFCGVPYDGPEVVTLPTPPVYAGGAGIAQAFERVLQEAFQLSGTIYAGGLEAPVTIIPAGQAVQYSGGGNIAATFNRQLQDEFKLAGTFDTGEDT